MPTITYHPEKESGYQWRLSIRDDGCKTTIHFETEQAAEQYVISILHYGELI